MHKGYEAILQILNAFIGIFTQPFEQDLKSSVEAIFTAITLAALLSVGLPLLFNGGEIRALQVSASYNSLIIALVWIFLTAIITKQDKKLAVARNLSVLSFWIAATLVIVLLVDIVCPNPLDGALRLGIAIVILIVLIPTHMFPKLPKRKALEMTICLCFSTIFLAWKAL